MNGIYDDQELGFFDTAPSREDIKEYLKVNENKVLRRFLEKHMWWWIIHYFFFNKFHWIYSNKSSKKFIFNY